MRSSKKAEQFTESVIREMTRVAQKHNCVNLAQGFPDFDSPPEVIQAAVDALQNGFNQYAITWGAQSLREAIAYYYDRFYQMSIDPQTEITVCCGATETMISSLLATVNPGEEIIIFEPFYENYIPDSIISGAKTKFVSLLLQDGQWQIDWPALEQAFNPKTAAIIINTPNNPTGKIFSAEELERIAELCIQNDVFCITDEIYDHIIFDDNKHIPPATIPGLADRTITINAMSKTFAVTGWRVGWAIAPPETTNAIRKMHDFISVGAPHPLQEASSKALHLPDSYYHGLAPFYQQRRDRMAEILTETGFSPVIPQGAYYMIAGLENFKEQNSMAFAMKLAKEIGVAVVPGNSFYTNDGPHAAWVRFCFGKTFATIDSARERLLLLKEQSL
jgi:aspartate/methionine/tyrosine aminotransferase